MSLTEQPTDVTTWRVDRVHSTVGFAVRHMVVSTFRGRFETYDATLVDAGGVLTLEGWVDVTSIVVRDPDLSAHLRSRDFFDAATHPTLHFSARDARLCADGNVDLHGELTVKGRTRPVHVTGTGTQVLGDPFGGIRRGLELAAVIDRRDYGLDWNLPLPKGGFVLDNHVHLTVDLELTEV